MPESPMKGMWGRYIVFIVLSIAVLVLHALYMAHYGPKKPEAPGDNQPAQVVREEGAGAAKPEAGKAGGEKKLAEPKQPQPAEKPAVKPVPEPDRKHPEVLVTLGSVDPESPYRMLVTATSRGAAVGRIELSSPQFHGVEDPREEHGTLVDRGIIDRSGYLGHLGLDEDAQGNGVPVQVVGDGTPAARAGLEVGDVIREVDGVRITSHRALGEVLQRTRPGHEATLAVLRKGKELTLPVTLAWRPMEVVRPENGDPLSFLSTLHQIDDVKLEKTEGEKKVNLDRELEGLTLRDGNWEVAEHDRDHVVFRRTLSKFGLEVLKTYRLAKVPEEEQANRNYPAYHLVFEIQVRNTGNETRRVAYQQDGPTGLPTEGWWYASKISKEWFSGVGLRDVVTSYGTNEPVIFPCMGIAKGSWNDPIKITDPKGQITFVGVDAQYFSAVMIPQRENSGDAELAQWHPIAVGAVPKDLPNKTDTSFRLVSAVRELKPQAAWTDSYEVFAGPRKPALLAQYGRGLKEIIYYGWFWWSAIPMLGILHFFHDYVVFNYGIAIIMLTVVVRGLMFPLSRRQALSAQKMQELQPEIKKIKEKYKNDLQALGQAQRELFAKHKYNPWGGCLIVFLQLPIFVGLYRALMVDVELRGAPLVSQAIRWASNLAAPDMLFDWSGLMPEFISRGVGFFGLGPFFNLLPIITIALFLWQQQKFMPPPTDEQAAMNMKVMKFMMIFMGIMFYKVAAGLCLYFIASSLWSIAERKYLPKTTLATATAGGQAAPPQTSSRWSFNWPAPGRDNDGQRGPARKKKRPRRR